jgi:hypothetical protein
MQVTSIPSPSCSAFQVVREIVFCQCADDLVANVIQYGVIVFPAALRRVFRLDLDVLVFEDGGRVRLERIFGRIAGFAGLVRVPALVQALEAFELLDGDALGDGLAQQIERGDGNLDGFHRRLE